MHSLFFIRISWFMAFLVVNGSYLGPFQDTKYWSRDWDANIIDKTQSHEFIVALTLNHADDMHQELQHVSNPKSSKYGKFYQVDELQEKYGASRQHKEKVLNYLSSIPNSQISHGVNDLIKVKASIENIESFFKTRLSWRKHRLDSVVKRALRADMSIDIPQDIQPMIAFVSLNSPITHITPRSIKSARIKSDLSIESTQASFKQSESPRTDSYIDTSVNPNVAVSAGNEESLLSFQPICRNGNTNTDSPPCSSELTFIISVEVEHDMSSFSSILPSFTNPLIFEIPSSRVWCVNHATKVSCNGSPGSSCYCLVVISPLPKYQQLRYNVSYYFDNMSENVTILGTSHRYVNTDVATPSLLRDLYHIPAQLTVSHNSNQSVAEFYNQFYSNSDLNEFMALSGLPTASIPNGNVFGDLSNNPSRPGGEAQLDVEYIMAIAPGANTFFYSFSDLNPYDTSNEGFLEYLYTVGNQTHPPLVHSLSYGDDEANIFNVSNPGSVEYGMRCDQEFMLLGLRGLTLVFASGDDGVSGLLNECTTSQPSWPASSAYVTTVGATQLSDEYLPVCGMSYPTYSSSPSKDQVMFQCTGSKETTCSSAIGGIITSGGGFSNLFNRQSLASWQHDAVENYLFQLRYLPPSNFFNSTGRAYPDVATYGSNYFVYINNKIVRESGTSASTPVFAAMVTLWNDMRLASGLPPLGFIAPFLYDIYSAHPEAFFDITTGTNACRAGGSVDTVTCCEHSFSAAPGWDATTGLGSPNFEVIASLVLDINTPFPSIPASNSYASSSLASVSASTLSNDSLVKLSLGLAVYSALLSSVLAASLIYWVIAARQPQSSTHRLVMDTSKSPLEIDMDKDIQ